MLAIRSTCGLFLALWSFVPASASNESPRFADIVRLAREGRQTLGYDGARKELFQFVSVQKDGKGNSVVQCVYSNETLEIREPGVPRGRFNTEHTWPQSQLKKHSRFSETRADLYHLFPTEIAINGARGNMPFLECDGEPESEGRVPEFCSGGFEPPEQQKGPIARAMFYMSIAYGMKIDSAQEQVFRQWNAEFPPSAEEIERGARIREVQGNENPFILHSEWVDAVDNF